MQKCAFSNLTLDKIDPEDFGDALLKLEKSFGINYADYSFKGIKTFGDVCGVIENKIDGVDQDDCTSQQAFYKIRAAIYLTQNMDKKDVNPQTKLATIFPRSDRRKKVKAFQESLGVRVDFLTIKSWIAYVLAAGTMLSMFGLIFKWQLALVSLAVFILLWRLATEFSKELSISTVRDLAEKFSREHYSLARRQPGIVNRKEIIKIIRSLLIADFDLDGECLTKDSIIHWS